MKKTLGFLSLAVALAVTALAHTSPLASKGAYCNDCCKGTCG